MMRKVKMNTLMISFLFLSMVANTSTSFAGQGDDEEQSEPDCDYISSVKTL
jgi:hypothetical protein